MQPITLLTGPLEVNTYIMLGARAGECFIVDPSDAALVRDTMADRGVKPTHILLTHGHFDHILAVAALQKEFGAKVCIHAEDAEALYSKRASLSVFAGMEVPPCRADVLLQGGETLDAAGFAVKVLHTPGHSKGSVCYLLERERMIFAGDTLFRLSVGRSDLAGGSERELYESIAYTLFPLAGDYDVYPGHMRKTTLEFERQHNPVMRDWGAGRW